MRKAYKGKYYNEENVTGTWKYKLHLWLAGKEVFYKL